MRRDAYVTFIGAKGVAFTWLGAAFGPAFLVVGLSPEYRTHLFIGISALFIVALSLVDSIRAIKSGSFSGILAYGVVPVVLLVSGSIYAWREIQSGVP